MATIRVYSRRPNKTIYQFPAIVNGQEQAVDNTTSIVINGANKCVNDGLISSVGMTVFKGEKRNPAAGTYSEADFARLKEHPIFKAALACGDYSYKESELSDEISNGMQVTQKELAKEPIKDPNGDGLVIMKPTNSVE